MANKFTILFSPVDAVGHFNACIGLAEPLRDRGHKVVFAVPNNNWKGKLTPQGFHEESYSTATDEVDAENQSEIINELVEDLGSAFSVLVEQQIEQVQHVFYKEGLRQLKASDNALRAIVSKVKPDVIVIDTIFQVPSLMDAGIPWIFSLSCNPIGISNKNVPPAFSGYPIHGDRKEWERYDQIKLKVFENTFNEFKSWVAENGGPELEHIHPIFMKYSPYANIYMYPEELDYTEYRPNPPNWHRFDTFVRSSEDAFDIPETLKDKPGKLIYFSMGTIGCSEFELMKRLIGILSKSPHRFIVSKGPHADKLELGENMWGAAKVPQTKVLPLVDLVITHGGNNTVTETLYFGKPMIVLPFFFDQLDNAQRISECGLGTRLHPYQVTETEFLAAIEETLSNQVAAQKILTMSKRMQSAESQSRAADLIEDIARNNKVNR